MTKPRIFVLLALLVLVGVIVSPVAANKIVTTGYFPTAEKAFSQEGMTNTVYTVNSSHAIAQIQIRAPKGTELNYTFNYGVGNTMSGFISYTGGLGTGTTQIGIGSDADSRSFVDIGTEDWSITRKWEIVGYAREESDNGTTISKGYAIYDVSLGVGNIGLQSGFIAYEPVSNVYPMESFSFTSNEPVFIEIFTADRSEIQSGVSRTYVDEANEWLQFALKMASALLGFVTGLFFLLKFLFIDNLLLIIALYISVTMAYSAITCRGNIFKFYKNFFKFQRSMIDFIAQLWNYLVQIISSFRGIFRI